MRERYNRMFEIVQCVDKKPSAIKTLDQASKQLIDMIKFLVENEGFEEVDILSNAEVIIAEMANNKLNKDA